MDDIGENPYIWCIHITCPTQGAYQHKLYSTLLWNHGTLWGGWYRWKPLYPIKPYNKPFTGSLTLKSYSTLMLAHQNINKRLIQENTLWYSPIQSPMQKVYQYKLYSILMWETQSYRLVGTGGNHYVYYSPIKCPKHMA